MPARGALHAVSVDAGAPIGAVFPASIVPLKHQFHRGIGRAEVNVGKESIPAVHRESTRSVAEKMLMTAGTEDGLVSERAREWRRVGTDPVPGVAVAARNSASGEAVIEPDHVAASAAWVGGPICDHNRHRRSGPVARGVTRHCGQVIGPIGQGQGV